VHALSNNRHIPIKLRSLIRASPRILAKSIQPRIQILRTLRELVVRHRLDAPLAYEDRVLAVACWDLCVRAYVRAHGVRVSGSAREVVVLHVEDEVCGGREAGGLEWFAFETALEHDGVLRVCGFGLDDDGVDVLLHPCDAVVGECGRRAEGSEVSVSCGYPELMMLNTIPSLVDICTEAAKVDHTFDWNRLLESILSAEHDQ